MQAQSAKETTHYDASRRKRGERFSGQFTRTFCAGRGNLFRPWPPAMPGALPIWVSANFRFEGLLKASNARKDMSKRADASCEREPGLPIQSL